jgi:hypothetical protein
MISGGNPMDQIYSVSFYKKLHDSTGHPADPCQGTIEVHATCEEDAISIASRRFAKLTDVSVWSLRADYAKVDLLPTRKRTSNSAWRRSRESGSSQRLHGPSSSSQFE